MTPPWMPQFFTFPVTTTFGAPTAGNPGVPHQGVDFATPVGTPVEAAGSGTVTKIFSDQLGGNQIQVKYANGGTGWFAHLGTISAKLGDVVTPQTVIGQSGFSGDVVPKGPAGAHLHYQLLDTGGQSVNPLDPSTFSRLVGTAVSVLPGAPTSGGVIPSPATSTGTDIPLVTGLINIGTNSGTLWRIGFILLGIAAVWVGGRMYFHESPAAPMKEAVSG